MIDAHQHFWRLGNHDCTWPTPDLKAIYRDFLPGDLAPLLAENGVTGTILVQSQESEADTRFLLQLAGENDMIRGVVGWTDLAAADAPEKIDRLAGNRFLKGLRPMLQGMDDANWILSDRLSAGLDSMETHSLSLDTLIMTRHLPVITTLARRRPQLAIVIDHAAKPPLADGNLAEWDEVMRSAASCPNVSCKLSGLLTEAGTNPDLALIRRTISRLLDLFGEERLIWGSDWPVHTLAGTYGDWLSLCLETTGPSPLIYGVNATRFYRL
ncbi:amidohydrolase family protein [Parvularcula flava]|uniref:Amidohydrolase n=1 Tax=Aquisalinus luteolus TaxID=1566827 RepID=A0A8J3A0C2_9PROT|nr:amidohydrolase family protein [Aquisalinus luteolus]NHK26474.1 amidohydrolase family protein [Aquisalinus luteolus]GGH92442.1 amidohydrolase [Aquisalinus luteolus]